jgi:hypothetical protein
MMKPMKLLAALLSLAAASPALAARYAPAPRGYGAWSQNAVRLEVGGATLSAPALYCGPNGNGCFVDAYQWNALLLGGELDLGVSRHVAITLGARALSAPYYTGDPSIFEPSVGVTFKFLRGGVIEPRLAVGVGLLAANNSEVGSSFRIGGGLSLFADGPVSLALDLMLEHGTLGGQTVNQAQFGIGPEFRF